MASLTELTVVVTDVIALFWGHRQCVIAIEATEMCGSTHTRGYTRPDQWYGY